MSEPSAEEIAVAEARREPVHPQPPTPRDNGKKPRSNLTLRLFTAAILIPPLLYVIYQGGPWVLGTVLIITMIGLAEFYDMIEAKGADPLRTFGMTAAAALQVVAYLGSEYLATLLLSVVLLGVMVAQLGKARIADALASISGTFFGVFYVGWLLSHAIVLRNFDQQVAARFGADAAIGIDPRVGFFYLFFTIVVVIGGDVGAYFAGRAYGKRKLAPRISPNKTVEGALGAVAAGIFFGLGLKAFFDAQAPHLSSGFGYGFGLVLCVVLSIVGLLGDLVESLLKRDAKVKDSGGLLPGMGGVLDRIDSNLLAIPVMYYLLLASTFVSRSIPG
ncbi:MAG: hypothetical protein CL910_01595 [Deltaproteobacteria bacterium]|jgi:phosphatidate cytidylyltransferase|nr:hypothetical protein [Deltaproteobacteria bacterium]